MVMDHLELPVNAIDLLPHRPPMILVDQLIEFSSGAGVVSAEVAEDSIFVKQDGQLEEVALVELVAQAYATIKGYDDTINHIPVRRGFLVGWRSFTLLGSVRCGDKLLIHIETAAELDEFYVVDGTITCDGKRVAQGSLKLWIP